MVTLCADTSNFEKSRSTMMSTCIEDTVPDLEAYLPNFVKDATTIQSLKLVRRANQNIVEFEIRFTGSSGQSKAIFDRIQAIKDKNSSGSNERQVIGVVNCDGPCRRPEVPANEMVQFGDCDHNICNECMRSSQARTLYDGSPCCCNERCLRAGSRTLSRQSSLCSVNSTARDDISNLSKSSKKTTSESQKSEEPSSGSSMDSQKSLSCRGHGRANNSEFFSLASLSQSFNRIVAVKIYAYFVSGRKLMRRTEQAEVLGSTAMRLVMEKAERLMASPTGQPQNKWYYAVKDKFHRSDLIPIEADKMANLTTSQMAGYEEVLSLVVVGPGTSI